MLISLGICSGVDRTLKLVRTCSQKATLALDLERGTNEHDGDFGVHDLVPSHDLEINVRNGMTYRVPLELASQDEVVGTINLQGQHLVEPVERKGSYAGLSPLLTATAAPSRARRPLPGTRPAVRSRRDALDPFVRPRSATSFTSAIGARAPLGCTRHVLFEKTKPSCYPFRPPSAMRRPYVQDWTGPADLATECDLRSSTLSRAEGIGTPTSTCRQNSATTVSPRDQRAAEDDFFETPGTNLPQLAKVRAHASDGPGLAGRHRLVDHRKSWTTTTRPARRKSTARGGPTHISTMGRSAKAFTRPTSPSPCLLVSTHCSASHERFSPTG